ncbi:hypothetical protein ZIOFF_069898 [Zingiber officinale]|uniref:Uncharacterized protein n=1 Tax=Zingiber officinale TaxID=94328 RepID=A0A8J5C4S1_ZINOF|nr:hypothetical protein ZIOFF_069898 [Zingiber officinale]
MRPKKQSKIAKYDEPRVVEDTELHQDADGLAATELRGETEIEEPSITEQKKTRGPTSMCRLIAVARWGKKSTIEYDDMGRPVYNENGKALQSFIGFVVRSMVPINIKSWPTIPENMKQKVWEEISNVFDLAPQSEAAVMSSAGQKWRDFKNKLNTAAFSNGLPKIQTYGREKPENGIYHDDSAPPVKAKTIDELHSLQKKRSALTTPIKDGTQQGNAAFATISEEER